MVGAILQKVYGLLSKKRLAALQKLQLGCSAFELPKLRFRAHVFQKANKLHKYTDETKGMMGATPQGMLWVVIFCKV